MRRAKGREREREGQVYNTPSLKIGLTWMDGWVDGTAWDPESGVIYQEFAVVTVFFSFFFPCVFSLIFSACIGRGARVEARKGGRG